MGWWIPGAGALAGGREVPALKSRWLGMATAVWVSDTRHLQQPDAGKSSPSPAQHFILGSRVTGKGRLGTNSSCLLGLRTSQHPTS